MRPFYIIQYIFFHALISIINFNKEQYKYIKHRFYSVWIFPINFQENNQKNNHQYYNSTAAMKGMNYKVLLNDLVSVSFKDQVLGSIPKWDAHLNTYIRTENALPHRAFSIFLFNSENKLLFQRRSGDKKTFPLCWTNTCCSHPNMIEYQAQKVIGVENIRDALHRALDRQLKMNLKNQDFYLVDKILYKSQGYGQQQFGQYEVDYVYLCKLKQLTIPFTQIPEEVCETKWVSRQQISQFINFKRTQQKCSFSPWFLKMFNNGLLYKWWDMAIKNQLKNVNTEQLLPVTSL